MSSHGSGRSSSIPADIDRSYVQVVQVCLEGFVNGQVVQMSAAVVKSGSESMAVERRRRIEQGHETIAP